MDKNILNIEGSSLRTKNLLMGKTYVDVEIILFGTSMYRYKVNLFKDPSDLNLI